MNLNVGFQNPITKNLNATLKSLNLTFLIQDSMNLDLLKHTKYGFAAGLLLYVPTLQTIRKVYQANRTIVNFPSLSCLLVFLLKIMIFASKNHLRE